MDKQDTQFTENLNPAQTKAVLTTDGPVLITAGAGSGKTRVLTHRIAQLISKEHVDPANILAITFTNKAAEEMRSRLTKLLDENTAEELTVSTFHSLCNSMLRQYGYRIDLSPSFTILDGADQQQIIHRLANEVNLAHRYNSNDIVSRISNFKSNNLNQEQALACAVSPTDTYAANIFSQYQAELKRMNAVDFDDLLLLGLKLLESAPDARTYYQNKFQYVHVDEYQDTNTLQYKLVHIIASPQNNICVVGDSDQAIYGWRGADIKNILDFGKDYPDVQNIVLDQNYRSTPQILDVANDIIKNNQGRDEKNLVTQNAAGILVHVKEYYDNRQEANNITATIKKLHHTHDYRDIAILYRNNSQARDFEQVFLQNKIPYELLGGTKFYSRKEIKDVLAYLQLIVNPKNDVAFKRIINTPRRGIGQTTIDRVEAYAAAKQGSMLNVLTKTEIAEIADLNTSAKAKLVEFRNMMNSFFDDVYYKNECKHLDLLVKVVIEQTGYLQMLKDKADDEANERIQNVESLINIARNFELDIEAGRIDINNDDRLTSFINTATLADSNDNNHALNHNEDGVQLMTIHAAKGLEFPIVFLTGMDESVFPNNKNLQLNEVLEEERRLAYVGITRAKQALFLSYTDRRNMYGSTKETGPNLFINEINRVHYTDVAI